MTPEKTQPPAEIPTSKGLAGDVAYTRGDWRQNYWAPLEICVDGIHIATAASAPDGPNNMNEVLANARLLAASPNLLSALKIIMEREDSLGDRGAFCALPKFMAARAREAIAKATGEPANKNAVGISAGEDTP